MKNIRYEFEKRVKNDNRNRIVVFIDEVYEIVKMSMVTLTIFYTAIMQKSVNIHF